MNKIAAFLILILFFSCSNHAPDYATVSGLIANNKAKEILIVSKGFKKAISINLDGTFSDTVKVVTSKVYTFNDGKNRGTLFVKNGSKINLNYDYLDLKNTISYSGKNAATNQYLIDKNKFIVKEKMNNTKSFYALEKPVFETRVVYLESKMSEMLSNNKIDADFKEKEAHKIKKTIEGIKYGYERQNGATKSLGKGQPSPSFVNYENYKGGTTSLSDLKGKYVYVDVWATWCGPCKREIPNLAKIEKEYHNKNIEFVSISVDDARRNNGSWDNAKDKWKKMVKNKKMGGIQLFATKGFRSDFIRGYSINSIPRFILIDPQGNIVNSNAPRPSNPSLKTLLNSLNI